MNILTQGLGCLPSGLMTRGMVSGAYFEVDVDTPLAMGGAAQPIGIRETIIFPIINLIGVPVLTHHPFISVIGHQADETYFTTQIIGHPEPTQTSTTQDILSQKTLDEAEARLDQLMKNISRVDLEEINKKIKIIVDAIKE